MIISFKSAEDDESRRQIGEQIVTEWLVNGAKNELNLPTQTRHKVIAKFNECPLSPHAFDALMSDLMDLMIDTYKRYKREPKSQLPQ